MRRPPSVPFAFQFSLAPRFQQGPNERSETSTRHGPGRAKHVNMKVGAVRDAVRGMYDDMRGGPVKIDHPFLHECNDLSDCPILDDRTREPNSRPGEQVLVGFHEGRR
jgi:hypothetical protein